MKNLKQIIAPIAAELQRFETFFEQTLKADTEPMNSIMRYVADTRGKRLRPILVLLSAKLFGAINEQTLRAATFVEMVHSATLLHDDVVDDDNERRGHASVKSKFGNLSAVLAGDYLLSKAVLLLSHPDDNTILQEMLRTAAAMSEGELMQGSVGLSYHGSRIDDNNGNRIDIIDASRTNNVSGCHNMTALQDRYLAIITRKTASLMRACCTAGALSAGASPQHTRQIADFGLLFGQLFQMRDDILDNDDPTTTAAAQALLPLYRDKTEQALNGFPESEALDTLRALTTFCAERTA